METRHLNALLTPKLAVDEFECASAIGMSVAWLRKDRRGKRLIPYYRIGGRILYSLERVQTALATLEEGGAMRGRKELAAARRRNAL